MSGFRSINTNQDFNGSFHKGFVEGLLNWLKIFFGKLPSTVLPHIFFSGAEALFAILEHEDADIICLQEVSWTTRREATPKIEDSGGCQILVCYFLNPFSGGGYFEGSDLESWRSCRWKEPRLFCSVHWFFITAYTKDNTSTVMGLFSRNLLTVMEVPRQRLQMIPRNHGNGMISRKNIRKCRPKLCLVMGMLGSNNEKLLKVS